MLDHQPARKKKPSWLMLELPPLTSWISASKNGITLMSHIEWGARSEGKFGERESAENMWDWPMQVNPSSLYCMRRLYSVAETSVVCEKAPRRGAGQGSWCPHRKRRCRLKKNKLPSVKLHIDPYYIPHCFRPSSQWQFVGFSVFFWLFKWLQPVSQKPFVPFLFIPFLK